MRGQAIDKSMIPHMDEARGFIIKILANHPVERGSRINQNLRPYGSDIWISAAVDQFYNDHHQIQIRDQNDESYYLPFYDAAWELARIGVLRPAQVAPRGMAMGGNFHGDGYSLTDFGITWVRAAAQNQPLPSDPSRFITVLAPFEKLYGHAFMQRASEAIHCHRTNNFLACCVMAGAAAESILLAVAIAKSGHENEILKKYRAAGGRGAVINFIVGSVAKGIAESFRVASGILSYWRDEAGHGQATTISEIEAFSALTQLLRLAQFVADNWDTFTQSK